MHREVEALLDGYEETGSFIERPAMEVEARGFGADSGAELADGQTLSHYRIVSLLGCGGMGDPPATARWY